jgi:hypothetical protein
MAAHILELLYLAVVELKHGLACRHASLSPFKINNLLIKLHYLATLIQNKSILCLQSHIKIPNLLLEVLLLQNKNFLLLLELKRRMICPQYNLLFKLLLLKHNTFILELRPIAFILGICLYQGFTHIDNFTEVIF